MIIFSSETEEKLWQKNCLKPKKNSNFDSWIRKWWMVLFEKFEKMILQIKNKNWECSDNFNNQWDMDNYCFFLSNLLYKDESVYECMSGGLPPDLHNISPWNLVWSPHFTRARNQARGQPKMLTPGPAPSPTHGHAHFCSLVP